jgi:integrase
MEQRIRISKRWAKGEDGETKTEASNGYVPLHPILADHLRKWQASSSYSQPENFVFPSIKKKARFRSTPPPSSPTICALRRLRLGSLSCQASASGFTTCGIP